MIRPDDQRLLQPCLQAGERLLWAGRPRRGLVFRRSDLFDLSLSLVVAAAVLVWEVADSAKDDSDPSWWVPFLVLLALYGIFRRHLREAWLRGGLLYAVSDRRVVVLETRLRRRSCALDLVCLPAPSLESEDDLGTLRFDVDEAVDPLFRTDYGRWSPSGSDLLSFEQIEHPQMVCNLIARESERRRRELLDSAVADPIFQR